METLKGVWGIVISVCLYAPKMQLQDQDQYKREDRIENQSWAVVASEDRIEKVVGGSRSLGT